MALHARHLHERALVGEPEQTLGRDPSPFGQALAVDLERRAVQELVRVLDPGGPEAAHVGVRDAPQVFERPIHDIKDMGYSSLPTRTLQAESDLPMNGEATISYNSSNPAAIGVSTP